MNLNDPYCSVILEFIYSYEQTGYLVRIRGCRFVFDIILNNTLSVTMASAYRRVTLLVRDYVRT